MDISRRLWRVWQRNFAVYKRTWLISFLPNLFEPAFYLLAFGLGLGAMVGAVTYRSESVSYVRFIAPGIVAIAVMQNSFFENTYASFVRMYYQKTFDAMLATPLSLGDVIAGEIFWGATKSLMAGVAMTAVLLPFGLVSVEGALLIIPVSILGGIAFGSIGMFFTGITPTIDVFNLPVFLFITPMFLFGGTFFPLENLPPWAAKIAYVLPLTHLVELVRGPFLGKVESRLIFSVIYLLLFSALLFPLAIHKMRKRLIK
ncbi:ABC transporter permease [bacterium]|nr:MAG: ABC transporter permease [bacterium]